MKRLLLILAVCWSASAAAQAFDPDTPYFFENFDPQQKPWSPGRDMNIEEVFKNFEYFEVIFGRDGVLKVSTIRQGKRSDVRLYRRLPDGGLTPVELPAAAK